MNPLRWVVLVGVVVVIVFAISFAVNFLPSINKKPGKAAAQQVRLTFAENVTSFPASPPPQPGESPHAPLPAACEVDQSQTHDFWFKNENAQDVPIGVFTKTCQCTSVQLVIAPKDWTEIPAQADRDRKAKELEAATSPTELFKEKEEGVPIPAGAVGILRLKWSGDHEGPKDLSATIWTGERGAGLNQQFNVHTFFTGPVRSLEKEPGVFEEFSVNVGEFAEEQLPRTVWIPCWSSTRTDFQVDARLLPSRWKEGQSLFVLGEAVKMTEKELDNLRSSPRKGFGPVLAGWNIPILLLPHAPLTKEELTEFKKDPANAAVLAKYEVPASSTGVKPAPFDLGPFRQRVELSVGSARPVAVLVHGSVQGDLGPENPADVPVRFGKFIRTEEPSFPLVLESSADVDDLEFDRERTPDFLHVKINHDPLSSGGRKKWTLEVKWVPGSQAGGEFPRDDEGFRDSAVYIRPVYTKPNTHPPTCLRVPVVGKADTQ